LEPASSFAAFFGAFEVTLEAHHFLVESPRKEKRARDNSQEGDDSQCNKRTGRGIRQWREP
jgi:hypothetical protein